LDTLKTSDPNARLRPLLLVGNPNVGKSVLFGALTGRHVNVSNYPGTTIEVTRGRMSASGESVELIDTPGTNHLIPMSEDERVTRDILVEEHGATIIQVGDAKNLRRTLGLTLELGLAERPTVLALNMMDEARSSGIKIDRERLQKLLGIPLVETVAIRRHGLRALQNRFSDAAIPSIEVSYPAPIEKALEEMEPLLTSAPGPARFFGILILSGDRTIVPSLRDAIGEVALDRCERIRLDASRLTIEPLSHMIQASHLRAVDALIEECYQAATESKVGFTHRFARWAIHPLKGIAVLVVVLAITFWFVGLLGAGTLVDLLETGLFGQVINPAAIHLVDAAMPFPHVHQSNDVEVVLKIPLTPAHGIDTGLAWSRTVTSVDYEVTGDLTMMQKIFRFIHDLLVGEYGIITMAFAYGFAIVLPIVATFFILFSLLEDSGYLPRLAVMANSLFRLLGLNGRAVLPMVLGLGCDTMATLTTRILDTRKQRLIVTLLLALGVPCSAQLGVLMAMMMIISPMGTAIWFITITAVMIAVGWLSSKIFRGRESDFLLEIPPIRKPVLSNIIVKTVARIEWYMREVLPLFVLGTLLLFVLNATGALTGLRSFASPIVQGWLGMPTEMTDAFLVGFLRRDYGAVLLLQAASGPNPILTGNQILVSMIVITLFVPCIANVFMIIKEYGARVATGMVLFIFPFAFLVGGVLMRIFRVLGVTV